MSSLKNFARLTAFSAALAVSALPATVHAGPDRRAAEAISLAKGKIESGDKVGASTYATELQSRARSSLTEAETLLARGKENRAIMAANQASELADQAMVIADKHKTNVQQEGVLDAQASAAAAQQSAAEANARAASAEQTAAAANAQAEALRNAPAPAATTTTTVEVQKVAVPRPAAKRVAPKVTQPTTVKKAPAPTIVEKTTTTVTTEPK